jgi:DNA polymerase-3 subunit delta'
LQTVPLAQFKDQFPEICRHLLQASQGGRLGHAYLLTGDNTALLEAFAHVWMQVCACTTPAADGDACGVCENCRRIAQENYESLQVVRPQSKTRRILMDDIRTMEHFLGLTAGAKQLKVGIVVEADRMMEAAQNAFLKTLEEPAPNTLILLLATRPKNLLNTIRSRCQIVSLRQNRQDYDSLRSADLFPLLARLRSGAGAAVGLEASQNLLEIFAGLRQQAETRMDDSEDKRWKQLAEDDNTLRKKLEEEAKNRCEAEYNRLRQEMLDAISAWFLQETLIAAEVPTNLLPHPELLEMASVERTSLAAIPEEAERHARLVDELMLDLTRNVHERLAIESFCLRVCEKRRA